MRWRPEQVKAWEKRERVRNPQNWFNGHWHDGKTGGRIWVRSLHRFDLETWNLLSEEAKTKVPRHQWPEGFESPDV